MKDFITDKQVLQMKKSEFIDHYLRNSFYKEFGTMEGFKTWKEFKDKSYIQCINNALDVYELILNENL